MNIRKALEELGLTNRKADVYLAALSVGLGSVRDIAIQAKLPRTTTHEIVRALCQLGLMSVQTKGRKRLYFAEKPTKLEKLLLEKQQKLQAVLPELVSMYNPKGVRPRVRFYDGEAGVKAVFDDTLTSKEKTLRGILSMEDLYKCPGKAYMKHYVESRVSAGMRLHVIRSPKKEIENTWPSSKSENREVHYAPKDMIFPMTTYIYDNKVGIIGTERELFGMIIESKEFYETQKNLFDVLWQVTKVMKRVD